ncbi:GlcNAc-PI de-N-acetylase [Clostridium botulinum]|uniref:N-acetylglucosaminylphosphatidylinositol deacetylase family protein n=1 Tax=Clostridium botulinum (strain Langeland / NCTC 10281 / Type F) TaxID=441772 RepID=A7GGU0_CLOBL|nr:PIG-L family deacetylase [Clostridium botulinum]ABS42636.1 N-acetylglucosaminylphosphatidylinositol deacetylase family protein [Clostridium botulinum F str. Langeland]ADG00393.1 N-acetylglucosaminylphosphatidylinositol deacetylase family protein [Clostridium botulinum F str. 230613]KKM41116.1 GlcNAc-PI de-N-acetylase [Clostridium botulinum]KOM96823.1 GlcNAc-PI de-N-acetylase [Clostridium botulinum]KOM99240.1 GlcNAc-PI de-N-acetylase [Clostridium botulinum]
MKVLFISVHPDDETLGCGGTILKHNNQGDEIYWMIITKTDELIGFSKEFIRNREKQIEAVSKAYNFKKIYELGFLTTKLHTIDFSNLIKDISKVINEIKPEVIYMNNRSDIHTDHQVAAKAIMVCTKSFRYPFIKKILMYECISETEVAPSLPENLFIPNVYSDITEYIDKKLEIMSIYESEVQQMPLPRSLDNIKALAMYRGASCGVNYAEAFMLIREVF